MSKSWNKGTFPSLAASLKSFQVEREKEGESLLWREEEARESSAAERGGMREQHSSWSSGRSSS